VGERLYEATLYRVRIPLADAFRSALDTVFVKEALLLRVRTHAGIGWSECAAQPTPAYAGETIDDVRLALRDHLLPRAFAGAGLDDVRGHAFARAALEDALLDARLRAEGVALAAHLGATARFVPAGVTIGMQESTDAFRRRVSEAVDAGYTRVKCKIEPGRDLEPMRAARAAAGPDVALAADANGSYDPDRARALLDAVEPLSLQCVEQPLPPAALVDSGRLVAASRTPIALDETITSAQVARDAIALGACNVIVVKPGRLGGLDAAKQVHDDCRAAGVPVIAGGMLETGIGRAALLALGALPGFTLTGDCSASARYFGPDGDLTEPFVLDGDGRIAVPTGPGIGVEPVADRLARATVAHERVTAGR